MAATVTAIELVLHSAEANWDRERWDELPDDGNRYEIIDGVLYMSTAPSPLHQWISRQTQRLLYRQLDDLGLGLTFNAPVGLFMPGCDPVQPDILVLRPEDRALILERRAETIPLLLVEVLSPSNPQHDLITKRQAYARAGVPEYWVLRPQERDLLLHSEPEPSSGQFLRVQHVTADGKLVSATLPIRSPLAALFALPEAYPSA
jgi:Uma2 family endonuclease